ncbi:glutamate dehydrogenase [Georgenia soli]|uniref:Glutamate dehydrogenase n=1 Tax=Georgenia soli TaxID=638953 RepID=A0A2A9ENN7_9MICO|nr:NAD-glutamate dehydrogenase [Georgenia soli]PFG39865.1 glutamate dehydrogenase [Georgenia soli]
MAATLDADRTEVLGEAAAAASDLPDAPQPDAVADLLDGYYRDVLTEDLESQEPRSLLGAALSHRAVAHQRRPGEAVVRVFTPTDTDHGWSAGRTVIEIVTDDMPFLVDSISAELAKQGRTIRLLVHPQPTVRRDDDGTLLEVVPRAAARGAVHESWIHVQVDRIDDAGERNKVAEALRQVLADVRAAVEDWPRMEARARDISALLLQSPPSGVPEDEIRQARQLLDWLVGGQFVFLGYREYDFTRGATPEEATLEPVPGTGLGILRHDEAARPTVLPPTVARKAAEPRLVIITKANSRSTVHRPVYLDYLSVKVFDDLGNVVGEQRFLGLFTLSAYTWSVTEVPFISSKVAAVRTRSGFAPASHLGKDLLEVLESYPRDELFQSDVATLTDVATAVVHLRERPRTRLFVRKDDYERFMSCLVYLARDRYTPAVERRVEAVLREAFDGVSSETNTRVSESALAQLHVVVRAGHGETVRDVDVAELERRVAAATRTWEEDLVEAAGARYGEEGAALARSFAFPEGYKEDFDAVAATEDLRHLGDLPPDSLGLHLYRPDGAAEEERRLKLYRRAEISLSAVLPIFQGLGLEVVDERPHTLADDAGHIYVYDFGLRGAPGTWAGDPAEVRDRLQDAFLAVWDRRAESDGFNALVLTAGLTWRQVVVIRALAAYLRQTGSIFSREYVEAALRENSELARLLVELFETRFDPAGRFGDVADDARAAAEEEVADRILAGLDDVASLDHDRIFRALLGIVRATLRTSYYQPARPGDDAGDGHHPTVAFKLDPRSLPDLPAPRPLYEIWVYGPRVEGVHLRFGAVARGGLRWSDRREDFRTEILGLVKAQTVKNAVIVPAGSKGGFFPKNLPDPAADRDAWVAEGRTAYRLFISSMLDITDNIVGGEVVPPADVVRHDGDDPYLVVAADKGTAAFSDVANEVSQEYGFWLDDAFASGGSAGYDHKKMGITARGAWEAVKRHFREMGHDTQTEDFTVAGIGDMSGDVFGNGMLLSEHIRLVAAFDHRHVFLDPDPDPATSYAERRRLFELPRSSWADYDQTLISQGGGVYPRTAKSVPVSPQVRERLGLDDGVTSLTPSELIRAVLTAPVDLLWNGGIGTYVKASTETNDRIGDRANDAIRVNGEDLRCKVLGEGGNLGASQLGRIEAATAGVRLNTDAIDNSAGVDSSDHEVNIKILLTAVTKDGRMSLQERNELLGSMTDEVAERVLRQNYEQSVLLGNARTQHHQMLGAHQRFMHWLEERGDLDRELEFLPSDAELARRAEAGRGLTSPEFAVLVAYAKLALKADLLESDLPDEPWFETELRQYFPQALQDRFAEEMSRHRLRREIIATRVANSVVNRGGITFVYRAMEETGASAAEVVRAFVVAREIFGIAPFVRAVERLDNVVPTDAQSALYLEFRRLLDGAVRWFVQHRPDGIDVADEIERFAPAVDELAPRLPELLRGRSLADAEERYRAMAEAGVPEDLARYGSVLAEQYGVLDVAELARRTDRPLEQVAQMRAAVEQHLGVDTLLARVAELPDDERWDALARSALRADLYAVLDTLTATVMGATDDGEEPDARLAAWDAANAAYAERARATIRGVEGLDGASLAPLSVALRALRAGVR